MKFNFKKNNGFSLVEVLIACSIIALTSLSLMQATAKGVELSNRALRQVEATQLIEEGVEAVKTIRDTDWNVISNLNLDTNYYLVFDTNTNTWSLSLISVVPIDNIFTRTIVFSRVDRDSNDNISSSGTLDTGSKKVNITVSWPAQGGTNSKNLTFYLTNIFN